MKLTNKDKEMLINWGYKEEDLNQIERATTKTTYEMNGKKISINEALNVLGRETFLSGISRSAFHWSAGREDGKGQTVYFNSSKLFK
jgi:hypothetical protein